MNEPKVIKKKRDDLVSKKDLVNMMLEMLNDTVSLNKTNSIATKNKKKTSKHNVREYIKTDVERFIHVFHKCCENIVATGKGLRISGLLTLKVYRLKAKMLTIPRNNQKRFVEERNTVKMKAGKSLKNTANKAPITLV